MTAERFRACVAVYGVLIENDRVLLMRRAGSGYRDGQLSLPAGHLDGDEDAVGGLIRELREEMVIEVDRADCQLATVMHRRRENDDDDEYLDLFFRVSRWAGTPAIGEPEKCTELVHAEFAKIPDDTADYIAVALEAVQSGKALVTLGWDAPTKA